MASPAQIAANRKNGQRATGPTSDAGKKVSSMNALKNGTRAQSLILPGEDPADLAALREALRADGDWVAAFREKVLEFIANDLHRLHRDHRTEASVLRHQAADGEARQYRSRARIGDRLAGRGVAGGIDHQGRDGDRRRQGAT